jgi:ketosteroid isomerase-like protein
MYRPGEHDRGRGYLSAVSRENVDVVRRSIEAGNAGQLDSAMSALAADAEWRVAEEHPESRICRGREEIRAYLEEWRHQLNDMRFVPVELFERGDHVVASGHIRGTGAGSSVEVEVPLAIVYTLRDGRIVRGEEYLEPSRALAAVGLAR